MQCIVHGSHFRLPMRIADQRVYLTFHLCNATFCFFSKTVLVYTQQHYINISLFHMPSTLVVFRLLEFLSVWDVCNPSFKVFAYNFTVWRNHHLFKSKFWQRVSSFSVLQSKQWLSNYFLKTNSQSENAGLNVPHIEVFDPYYPPVTWKDFTILHSYLQYLHIFYSQMRFKSNFNMFCIYLIFSFV